MAAQVPDDCPLSPRQFEVLQLLGEGLAQGQVADRLGITTSGLRSINNGAFRKLGCSSATQAVALMGRHGWLDWTPAAELTPLAAEHPFLAAYLREFERSRWPHEPDRRSAAGMRLALAGHRLNQ